MFINAKAYERALQLCLEKEVHLTDEMAESMTLPKVPHSAACQPRTGEWLLESWAHTFYFILEFEFKVLCLFMSFLRFEIFCFCGRLFLFLFRSAFLLPTPSLQLLCHRLLFEQHNSKTVNIAIFF